MTTALRVLRCDEPVAAEFAAVLKQGDVEWLGSLLAADPGVALCVVVDPDGGGRSAPRNTCWRTAPILVGLPPGRGKHP